MPRIVDALRACGRFLSNVRASFTDYLRTFGRFQPNARLYLISSALSGVTLGIILVLYNLYLVSLGYDTYFVGLIILYGTLGAGLAIFPAGLCVDRFGGKAILIWASVAVGIAGAGQLLFRDALPLLVTSFLAGIGGAFILVVNLPFLTRNSNSEERPQLFSLNIVVTLITTVLGELIGGVLPGWLRSFPQLMAPLSSPFSWVLAAQPEARSYQISMLLAGIIALPSFVPLFFMTNDRPLSKSRVATRGMGERRWGPLRPCPLWGLSLPLSLEAVRPTRVLISPIFMLTLMETLRGLGAGLWIPYLSIYIVKNLGASPVFFGIVDGSANTLNAVLTLVAPLLALRIGKVNTITITRLASIPLMLIIGLSGSALPLVALAVLYPVRQGLMDMAFGIFQVFSMEAIDRKHRGLANSSYQAAFQVAWAISAPLGGYIIARAGYLPVFIVAAAIYLLFIGLFWWRFHSSHAVSASSPESPLPPLPDTPVSSPLEPPSQSAVS